MKISFSFLAIIFLSWASAFSSCASPVEEKSQNQINSSETEISLATELTKSSSEEERLNLKRVDIQDQALNIRMLSINIPEGWTLHQDIASNPNGSGYLKFLLALESPEGEIQGLLPLMMNYHSFVMNGQHHGVYFDDLIPYLMHYCSQPFLEKFTPGKMIPDQEALASTEGEQIKAFAMNYAQMASQAVGIPATVDFDMVRMEFSAFRKNVPYKGLIKASKVGVINQNPYMTSKNGVIMGFFTLAPEKLFAQASQREIDMQLEINPQWGQKRSEIIDLETRRMSQDHQARMAQQRAQFNAHQQNMASMRESFDQHNQAWRERNFGSGGSSSYSGNASVIDAITGYTSFSDPYTGQQIKKEGNYNYWYTNEFGEYHGTDDPNFKPQNHYSGNWKPIQPLKPDH